MDMMLLIIQKNILLLHFFLFRLLHAKLDPDTLIGFNNTGNICESVI